MSPNNRVQEGLDGRVAVVTGAGQGLGRAEALDLARHGARVVVNDVRRELAENVAGEIAGAGGSAVPVVASVSTAEGGRRIAEAALDAFGSIDILVNNAGFLRPAPFEDLTATEIQEILDVHLAAGFHVTQPI